METAIIEEPKIVNQIAEFNEFELNLSNFKKQYKGLVYDLDKPDEVAAAKENHKEIRKAYNSLEKIRVAKKAEFKAGVDLIDGEGKRIKDQFDVLCKDIKDQQDAHAQKAILYYAALQAKVDDITAIGIYEEIPTLDELKKDLERVKTVVLDDSFDTRKADAALAVVETTEVIESKIALMEKRVLEEKAEKELAAKAQAEREEKIRVDALAEAAKEKEQALKKAKQDKELALKTAKDDQEKAIKAEQDKAKLAAKEKEQAAHQEVERLQAKAEKEAAELLKKQNNQKHRASIHKEIKESIMATKLLGEKEAIELVKFLMTGDIKNVTINY
jgi:hypothetical protein